MKVLLTGAKGQLGRCFIDRFPAHWQLLATDKSSLDISNFSQVSNLIEQFCPDVIVNTAAYTAVELAETEQQLAYQLNAIAVEHLAKMANKIGALLISISTDYVFDGLKQQAYTELDRPNPLNIYGKSKLAGEQFTLNECNRTLIIRTSWLYSEYGQNFPQKILNLAKQHNEIQLINDQIGSPTYAGDLAQAIIDIIAQQTHYGVFHYAGAGSCSWYEFAQAIFKQYPKAITLTPCASNQYPTKATRPHYSVLDSTKIQKSYGLSIKHWSSGLSQITH